MTRQRGSQPGERSHNWRGGVKHTNGYVYRYMPGHPHATKDGYVLQGVVNWEEANDLPFPKGKVPHHKDLNKRNDAADNIEPLTRLEHKRLHALLRSRVNGKYGK